MNLAPLLRQQVTWQVRTGLNTRGEAEYGASQTVRGRCVAKLRDIIGPAGEVVTITAQVTLLVEPSPGDLLAGREVITVAPIVDIGGRTLGYLANTR